MRPSGRNGGRMVVVVDKSSKAPLLDNGGQSMDNNEGVGGIGVEIEEGRERTSNNNVIVKNFNEEHQYPTREQ